VRIASSGEVEASHLRSASFVQPEEIAPLAAGWRAGQSDRWRVASDVLRRDPALAAWISFEKQGDGSGVEYGGTVRGARWVQGRFAGKDALEFVDTGDAVQLDVGGQHTWPQLTMMVWVRLDRLDGPYQSLYHTDGWFGHRKSAPDQAPNVGQVHWIVLKSGVMRWAMWGNTPRDPAAKRSVCWVDSHTSVLAARGRWVHLAVTYDAPQRATRFYVDGRLDAELWQDVTHPAVLGSAQIGNWNLADRKLSGRIDEFAILGRVLSDQEIRDIYAAGTPYR
jgi:hypothetical protein